MFSCCNTFHNHNPFGGYIHHAPFGGYGHCPSVFGNPFGGFHSPLSFCGNSFGGGFGTYNPMNYWNSLPMMVTNYGGDTQVSVLPDAPGSGLSMMFNPIACGQMAGGFGNNGIYMPAPFIPSTPEQIQSVVDSITLPILQKRTDEIIKSVLSNIASASATLDKLLSDDRVSAEDKAEAKRLQERLKAAENKVKTLMNSNSTDIKTANSQAKDYETEVKAIFDDLSKLGKKIGTLTDSKTDETDSKTEDSGDSKPSDDASSSSDVEGKKTDTKTEEADKKRVLIEGKNYTQDDYNIASVFNDAVQGIGTDNDKLEAAMDALTEENIMGTVDAYATEFGESGVSFFRAFLEDANMSQGKTYTRKMRDLLRLKCAQLGIIDECADDFKTITKAVNTTWFWISTDLADNFDRIAAKIKAKEAELKKPATPATKPVAGSEKDSTEDELGVG